MRAIRLVPVPVMSKLVDQIWSPSMKVLVEWAYCHARLAPTDPV